MKKLLTAFFVEESSDDKNNKNDKVDSDFGIELLVLGKKCGLSLAEMNEFRVRDLLDFVEIYTGANKNRPRTATQEDIDKFYASF